MVRFRVEFERNRCIGATSCNDACPDNWEIQVDGKSDCKIKEFDESQLECNLAAAKACPVKAIHIINLDTNERMI